MNRKQKKNTPKKHELCQRGALMHQSQSECALSLIQFQSTLHTINWRHVGVMRLILKKNFDGLDSFHA